MSPAVFNNLSGATFRMWGDGQPFARYGDYSTFNNANGAFFVKSGGTNEVLINSFIFNNQGEVRSDSGTLTFSDIANFAPSATVIGNTLVRFAGEVRATNTLTVLGTVRLDGGNFTAYTNGASAMKWTGPSTLQWRGGAINGTMTVASNVLVSVMNPDGANIAKFLGSAATFNNEGVVEWTGPGQITCDGRPSYGMAPCTFNNRAGAQFRMLSDGTPFYRYGDMSVFNNEPGALVVKVAGTNETQVNAFVINNAGAIRNQSGILRFTESLNLSPLSILTATNAPIYFSGTIVASNTLSAVGAFRLDSGTLYANGVTTRYQGPGTFEWTGGTISGNFTVSSNVTLNVFTPGDANVTKAMASATVLVNEGTVHWTGPGTIFCDGRPSYGQAPGAFTNRAGAVFQVLTDGTPFQRYGDYSVFYNEAGAIFEKVGGTNATVINNFLFNNAGLVRANIGSLDYSDYLVMRPGAVFAGPGSHNLTGTALLQGLATVNGATFNLAAGNLGATVNSNATFATTAGGLVTWTGGVIAGDLTVAAGSAMEIAGSVMKTFDSGAVFRNLGTVRWLSTGDIFTDARPNYGYSPVSFNNEAGAVFSVEGNANFSHYSGGSVFRNKAGAIFRKKTATGSTTVNWTFENAGTIDLQSGTVVMPDQTLNAAGGVRYAIGGTSVGTQYGVLNNYNSVMFQGACTVVFTNGYTPVENDTFTVFTYGSRSGQFSTLNLPALPYLFQWKVTYGASALTLAIQKAHVLSAPSVLANGQVQLALTGPGATMAILETSTNLVSWQSIATNAPFSGTFNFNDAAPANIKNKFYRIQIVP
jgi:hypothetical protein